MKITSKFFIFIMFFSFILNTNPVYASKNLDLNQLEIQMDSDGNPIINEFKDKNKLQEESYNNFFSKYKGVLVGLSGLIILTFIILIIFNINNLAKFSDNPNERQKAISGLFWTIISLGGFSSIVLILSVSLKLFQ